MKSNINKCSKGHEILQENRGEISCPHCLQDKLEKANRKARLWKARFLTLAKIMIHDCTLKRKILLKTKKNST